MSNIGEKTTLRPIQLDFRSERPVVVVPEDEDRFVVTSKEAARACRSAANEQEWKTEFNSFLTNVHDWCKKHSGSIDNAYLSLGDEGLKLFLATNGDEYDFSLDDDVAKLGIDLTNTFPGCPVDVLHVPNTSLTELRSFFSPSTAIQLYAQSGSP